jgi:hypothetical protein
VPICEQVLALMTNLINIAAETKSDTIRTQLAKQVPALVAYAARFELAEAPFTSSAVRVIGCPTQ